MLKLLMASPLVLLLAVFVMPHSVSALEVASALEVLVFSKTTGFRHVEAIPVGNAMLRQLAEEHHWKITFSEKNEVFTPERLATTDCVVWNNPSGNVLNPTQRIAFQAYLMRGGGFVGIHNAMHAEMNWPYYRETLGATFQGHGAGKDQFQASRVVLEEKCHPITRHFPASFRRTDEWYNFSPNPRPFVSKVLLRLDEATLNGPNMGGDHPIAWTNESEGERVFYTAFGHTASTFREPEVVEMFLQAILWAANTQQQTVLDEFNGCTPPGTWSIQQPFEGTFPFTADNDKLALTGIRSPVANQQLTREGVAIDAKRPYAMQTTFRITTTGGVQSFAMNFLQEDQPTDAKINAWSLNLDLNGDGTHAVIKHMGFRQGKFAALGPSQPAKWAKPNTEYIYRVDVNRRLDGSVQPKWVTAKIQELNGTVHEHFEVDYSKFPWQPNLDQPVRIGLNSHFASWEVRNLKVFYTDEIEENKGN